MVITRLPAQQGAVGYHLMATEPGNLSGGFCGEKEESGQSEEMGES